MALRAAGVAQVVTGYDAGPGAAEHARERGAIDLACADVSQAVAGADLIVLAAPIRAAPHLFTAIAPYLTSGALVTDLCSVKAHLVACAERSLPHPSHFVGSHPMTGSERSGVEAARADLYERCVWPLTPIAYTAPEAIARLSWMIGRLGATPLLLAPAEHDAAVALISHLPRIAATGLILTAAQSASWPVARELAAGGFRDTTRVASGDPAMMLDICGARLPRSSPASTPTSRHCVHFAPGLRMRMSHSKTRSPAPNRHETAGYERAAIQVILNQTHDADDARGKRSSRVVCDRQRMNRVSTSAGNSPCYTGVAVIY